MADQTVEKLLDKYGQTFADQAHITLNDDASSPFRLLMLCMLQAKPIAADIAVQALLELNKEKLTTPERVRDASRRQFINAFKKAGYSRYDESSTTYLQKAAQRVCEEFDGDMREIREADNITKELQKFEGVGPACADMFAREAQALWPELAPAFDKKAQQGAEKLGLPTDPAELAELVDAEELPRFAAALVRVALDKSEGDPLAD